MQKPFKGKNPLHYLAVFHWSRDHKTVSQVTKIERI